jgi:ubiquinone/menaquinone biosynthesis C-methylase UbiE
MKTMETLHPKLVEKYFEILGEVKIILDLGCGNGSIGKFKRNSSIEIIGIDIDINLLKEASKFENVLLYDLEKDNLPFPSNYFDGIIAKDILEHVYNPSLIMTEIYRILKPDKKAILSVPMAKPSIVWDDYTHIRGFTKKAIIKMVKDHNFELISISSVGSIPGFGVLNLNNFIPIVFRIPGISRFAKCYQVVIKK